MVNRKFEENVNDLYLIVLLEWRTFLRGLVVGVLIFLPFTYLPLLSDLNVATIAMHLPHSLVYSFGLSLLAVLLAVAKTYKNLLHKKSLFDRPVFTSLQFKGGLDGMGSIFQELSTFLLGKVGDYFFRIDIGEPYTKDFLIEITPLINVENKTEAAGLLYLHHGFSHYPVLHKVYRLSEEQLNNTLYLKEQLEELANCFARLHLPPLNISSP